MDTPLVRPSRPDDAEAILSVVMAAFTGGGRDGGEEVDIVRRTWAARPAPAGLELVAEEDGVLVGHVLAATGRVDGVDVPVAGVAPVSVAPSHQGRGVGSALMWRLLADAAGRGWPLLVLLGHPTYYPRFGFEPAGPRGLHYAPAGRDNPNFMARPTGAGGNASWRGEFSYCWE
jgi:predicted N-acetyltransferase YhbS